MTTTMTEKQLRTVMRLFQLTGYSPSLQEVKKEELKQKLEAEITGECSLLAPSQACAQLAFL